MPLPLKKKFKHYRGDDWRYSFRLEQPKDTPMDLTGWTTEVTVEGGYTVTSSTPDNTGVIVLSMTAEETDAVVEDLLTFDFQMTDTTGFRRTYLLAEIRLVDDV